MANFIKGEVVILSVWDGIDSYDPIACLTSNDISFTKNMIESQTKCNAGRIVKTPGSKDYEISFEAEATIGEANQTVFDFLQQQQADGVLLDWKISDFNGPSADSYYGSGYISELSFSASAGDEIATFSGTIVGDGETTVTTVAPNP